MLDEDAARCEVARGTRRDATMMRVQPDDPGPGGARDDLDRLSAGALEWIRGNLEFLDPASAELPTSPRVKATLELALFCFFWARLRPGDNDLGEITAFIRKIWQNPDFPHQLASEPIWSRQYGLIYGALAPAGITSGFHQDKLAELAADGWLEPRGKSSYLRLETRYYADLAGLSHRIESYAELYASSLLAKRASALPPTNQEAYTITHTVFYLSGFGLWDPGLARDDCERAHRIVCQLTDHYVQHDQWDLAGEFILAQFCLGGDLTYSPSGAAGIQRLRQVQLSNGAIPGRSAEQQAEKSATAIKSFQKCYHTTLLVALIWLIISSTPRKS